MGFDKDIDPEADEIFVAGLPLDVTEEELAEYFGQIGVIKEVFPSIILFLFFFSHNTLETTLRRTRNVVASQRYGFIATKPLESRWARPPSPTTTPLLQPLLQTGLMIRNGKVWFNSLSYTSTVILVHTLHFFHYPSSIYDTHTYHHRRHYHHHTNKHTHLSL